MQNEARHNDTRQTEMFDAMSSFSRMAFDAGRQMMELNARTIARMTEKQVSLMGQCLNHSIEHMDMIRDAKDLPSFLARQTELMKACGEQALDQAMDTTRETMDMLAKTRDEMSALMESGMNVAKTGARNAESAMDRGMERNERAPEKAKKAA
jgi:phasin family protein